MPNSPRFRRLGGRRFQTVPSLWTLFLIATVIVPLICQGSYALTKDLMRNASLGHFLEPVNQSTVVFLPFPRFHSANRKLSPALVKWPNGRDRTVELLCCLLLFVRSFFFFFSFFFFSLTLSHYTDYSGDLRTINQSRNTSEVARQDCALSLIQMICGLAICLVHESWRDLAH